MVEPRALRVKPICFKVLLCVNFQALIVNVEDGDVDKYTEEIQSYDSISRLDSWYTTLLLRVKKQISASDLL